MLAKVLFSIFLSKSFICICCRYVPIRSVSTNSKSRLSKKLSPETQNKPNGQFQLDFDSKVIREFMRDLSIRKVPGIGRVNERLLESIGIKVSQTGCAI